MTEISQPDRGLPNDPVAPDLLPAQPRLSRARLAFASLGWKIPAKNILREFALLIGVTTFLLLYGLVPIFGGDQLGLVGADEPRYAQIAREMLAEHNALCDQLHADIVPTSLSGTALRNSYRCLLAGTVTPILHGRPWLEKPALYYWRAMGFFREFGVSDWSARLPSSSGAFALAILIYLHMRRFRPGAHLGAALITVSSLGIVSFARGASTDMQLAAPFAIGMLGWYDRQEVLALRPLFLRRRRHPRQGTRRPLPRPRHHLSFHRPPP